MELLAQVPESHNLEVGRTHLLLAKLYTRKSLYEKALLHAHSALQALKDSDSTACHLVFSWICRVTGQLTRAQEWLSMNDQKPSVDCFIEQGLVCRELGNYREAESHFLRALDLSLQTSGPRELQSVRSCHCLGVIYCVLGRYNESRNFLKACVAAVVDLCGDSNLLETEVWQDYALLCLVSGNLVEAEIYACKALYERKNMLGQEALGLAKNYTLLGSVFTEEGKAVRAEKMLIKAIAILRINQGSDLDTGSAYMSLAYLYLEQMEFEHALRNAERGFRLLKTGLPERHADRGTALMLLALVLKGCGKPAEATVCWDRMLQAYGASLPEEHSYVGRVLAVAPAFKAAVQKADEKWLSEFL